MIEMSQWITRKFPYAPPAGEFPMIVERLRGTPVRLEDRIRQVPADLLPRKIGEVWSIQENVGHLGDLEPLWATRFEELLSGKEELVAADMSNRRTYDAQHNDVEVQTLLERFRNARTALVDRLESLGNDDIVRTALHPRLKQPMRTIDLCLFIAEHDDHHLARITTVWRTLARGHRA